MMVFGRHSKAGISFVTSHSFELALVLFVSQESVGMPPVPVKEKTGVITPLCALEVGEPRLRDPMLQGTFLIPPALLEAEAGTPSPESECGPDMGSPLRVVRHSSGADEP